LKVWETLQAWCVLHILFGILDIDFAGTKPQGGYTTTTRGSAPGNERERIKAHDVRKFENPTFFAPQGAPVAELVTWVHLLSGRNVDFLSVYLNLEGFENASRLVCAS
jgi:hypothetical protein